MWNPNAAIFGSELPRTSWRFIMRAGPIAELVGIEGWRQSPGYSTSNHPASGASEKRPTPVTATIPSVALADRKLRLRV